MSDDGDDGGILNRRDMFKAGVLGTGLAAYASLGTEEVQANHTTPTEPLITLGDSFELFDSGDDAVIKHVPSGAHFTYNNAESRWEMDAPIQMTEAQVINETVVKAHRSSDTAVQSSGTWVQVLDGEDEDNLNELNTSFQFTPNETGDYLIHVRVFFNNHADGDRLNLRIQDVDTPNTIRFTRCITNGTGIQPIVDTFPVELTAGTTYEIQGTDTDSSFNIDNGPIADGTRVSIKRSVVDT